MAAENVLLPEHERPDNGIAGAARMDLRRAACGIVYRHADLILKADGQTVGAQASFVADHVGGVGLWGPLGMAPYAPIRILSCLAASIDGRRGLDKFLLVEWLSG